MHGSRAWFKSHGNETSNSDPEKKKAEKLKKKVAPGEWCADRGEWVGDDNERDRWFGNLNSRDEKYQLVTCKYDPEKIICVGMNYREHCTEQNFPIPTEPVIFSKFAN